MLRQPVEVPHRCHERVAAMSSPDHRSATSLPSHSLERRRTANRRCSMGIHMTRGLWTAAALMVTAICAASPAAAQELQAKVPFDFAIGTSVLPAGDYTIEEAAEPALLAVRARDGKASAFVLT